MCPEQTLAYIKAHVKKEWVICFMAALFFGMLAHIYKLTNFLPNWDSLLNMYTDQNKTNLGRCFLMYACSISSYYDLPWLNGILSLIYIAGSAVCIVELFEVKRKIPAALIGGLMVTFPTVTSTLAYNYTADGYFLALLCMCVAVLLVVRCRRGVIPAAFLIAFGVGVYQAYITVAMILMLVYLIFQLLFENLSKSQFWKWIRKFATCGILGCAGYWVSLKGMLLFSNAELSQYQNIDEAFSLHSVRFIKAILWSGYRFLKYFFDFSKGINLFLILNCVLVLLIISLFLLAFYVKKTVREPWRFCMILLCAIMIPIASYALYFISAMDYHNLMVMCLCMIYILPLLFYERLTELSVSASVIKQWVILGVSILIIYNFIVLANISYQKMHIAYEKSYGVILRVADRIEQLPEAKECKKIAVLGYLPESEKISVNFPPDMTGITDSYIIRKQDTMMQENVTQAMLRDYCGIEYEDTTEEDIQKLRETKECIQMKAWPEENSVTVIEDTLVIKFGGEMDE